MQAVRKIALGLFPIALLIALIAWVTGNEIIAKAAGAIAVVALPIGLGAIPLLRGYQFTAWIVAAVVCPLLFPHAFLNPQITETFSIRINHPWAVLIIIQLVMFGMGTQMSLRDFAGVARMPHAVLVGLICQFTIMPLVGFSLAKVLGFPPEIGAGLVLIGSCSSGLASNVMAHMARINLPLSITLTACATALAPFITPFWLTTLNTGVEKNFAFIDAMMSIFKIVIAPIGAAMIHDLLKHIPAAKQKITVYGIAGAGAVWLLFLMGRRLEFYHGNLYDLRNDKFNQSLRLPVRRGSDGRHLSFYHAETAQPRQLHAGILDVWYYLLHGNRNGFRT